MSNLLKVFSLLSASLALMSIFGFAADNPYVETPLPEKGTKVPGESLTDKLAWLETHADSRSVYILEVNADENIAPRTLEYEGATDVFIVLRGVGENRTLRLASHGTMFTVKPNVRFILDSNITLQGHPQNTGPMVEVNGGYFCMRTGSSITGNDRGSDNGGGVYVRSGVFAMTGGVISGNTVENGGGVYVLSGNFIMTGGVISGNTAENGGGVHVADGSGENAGHFTMLNGFIIDNTANRGGGVYNASFTMATISGYTVWGSNFKVGESTGIRAKQGCGIITRNTARKQGGGIYLTRGGNVVLSGLVTGYEKKSKKNGNVDKIGNVVRDEEGKVLFTAMDEGGKVVWPGHSIGVGEGRNDPTSSITDDTKGKQDCMDTVSFKQFFGETDPQSVIMAPMEP